MPDDAGRPHDDERPVRKLGTRLMLIAIFAITVLSIFGGQIFLRDGEHNGDAPTPATSVPATRPGG